MKISDEAVEAAAKAVYGGDHLDGSIQRDAWLSDFRIALEAAAPYMMAGQGARRQHPAPDPLVEDLVDIMIEADRTADSPTVFTRWHHYAEFILSAGYRKPQTIPLQVSAWLINEHRVSWDEQGNGSCRRCGPLVGALESWEHQARILVGAG